MATNDIPSIPNDILDRSDDEHVLAALDDDAQYETLVEQLEEGNPDNSPTDDDARDAVDSTPVDEEPADGAEIVDDPSKNTENPFAAAGIPDDMVQDGKILGKYTSVAEFVKGHKNLESLVGKKGEEFLSEYERIRAANSALQRNPQGELPPGPEGEAVAQWLDQTLRDRYRDRIDTFPESQEDWNDLRMADPVLFIEMRETAKELLNAGNEAARLHQYAASNAQTHNLNVIASDVAALEQETGFGDESAIEPYIKHLVTPPSEGGLFGHPNFYEHVAGIPMLRPGAVKAYLTLAANDHIIETVRERAASQAVEDRDSVYRNRAERAGQAPRTVVGQQGGMQGTPRGLLSPEQLLNPRVADTLTDEELDRQWNMVEKLPSYEREKYY